MLSWLEEGVQSAEKICSDCEGAGSDPLDQAELFASSDATCCGLNSQCFRASEYIPCLLHFFFSCLFPSASPLIAVACQHCFMRFAVLLQAAHHIFPPYIAFHPVLLHYSRLRPGYCRGTAAPHSISIWQDLALHCFYQIANCFPLSLSNSSALLVLPSQCDSSFSWHTYSEVGTQ